MNDEAELIGRLLTLAGSIMEDASPIAIISVGGMSVADRIATVAVATNDAGLLLRAADVIQRRMAVSTGELANDADSG